jgi:signal transduction histidine kinase
LRFFATTVLLGMLNSTPPLAAFPADLQAAYPPADLLWGILEASLTGLALYSPLWDEAGQIIDFRIDLLNPAAQQMLGHPARPTGSYLELYPHTRASGVFAFHQQAFESGEPARFQVNYQADGLDNYFQLSARRVGQGLLVSFSDTADADRSEVEVALRASQQQAQAARARAEYQRNQFQALVDQAPVALGFFEGPELRVMAANQQLCTIWGHPSDEVLHRPLLEALPELHGQGFDDLLRQVLATEVPVVGTETPAQLLRNEQLTTAYFDFVYKPFYTAAGTVQGVINVSVDVTAQVVARQQLQALTDELLAANQELERVTISVEAARAEAELQRQQLHHVLEQAPAMICIFDGPQHTFQFVNPPYQALVGERPLVGQPIAEAMPELAGQPIFSLLDEVYRTGQTFYASEMLVQLDHLNEGQRELEKRYYNFIYQARHDLAGAVDGILVFAYEVTVQVQARQQVERAREEVLNLNEELAALNEELQASNDEYQLANTALSEAQQQLYQLNQALEARVHERTHEVVAARAATEQQRLRLEQLLTQAPAGICMLVGPTLVFELVNPVYQALFPGRALQSKPLLEALPELTDQPVWHTLQQVYQTGTTHQEWGIHIPVATYEGGPLQDFYFNYIQQARYDERGHIDGVVVFVFDVTEQVQAREKVQELNAELAAINEELQVSNEELSETNQQLTRTNVDLDNFIYTASHDLKQPITNIEGLLLALQHELPPAGRVGEVPTMLHLMQEAVERFGRTITHLTDVSRLQQAHAQPATQVSLARVVQEVQLDLAPLITQTAAQVLVAIPTSITLLFAEKNLRSVVYNLLSNALKYRHLDRAPVVRLTYQAEASYQVLEVQDNGLGLDLRQSQDKLFAMFQHLHTHVEGTGLGLYMVKKMVENVGGRIEVQSELERGATFRVYFPR